ncbi:metal ABC transporter permease [Candidatus Endoriftia persephonae]|jgi:zinc transport system permease protein|uniref:Zinc ABC transporter, inner membrane permease protein ZnuB n=2 Tax=Gammaproteobacteria TaxID=1236 RepID=G2FI47_9GAMM|nr:metal ABC transporter permease [Candidatus Endoriftia persephone]EGW53556.1 zinc ABC transporter, inner membrane permease protein ZnuB [endosymbiont of Tevnia jerichonana (vent Tica)]USF86837.1 metal ABC transporter permease [Candidatus Endoriftia persephone]
MSEFLTALTQQTFLQSALLAGLLASVGCGVMGSFVVVKRIAFLAGGIAHSVLGGMGAALYFGFDPLLGALLAAISAALIIGWVRLNWQTQEDTLIGALWAIGMAAGILFISRTPGYATDLMSYLFGNILLVPERELWIMAGLDAGLLLIVVLFYRQFLAVAFDEEFARLRGVPVTFFYLLLLCLVAVTVVLLIQVVGLILVIALLTLPAAIASHYLHSLGHMMLLATLIGGLFTSGGLALSYTPDLPAGPTIILLAGAAYVASALLSHWLAARQARRGVAAIEKNPRSDVSTSNE